MSRNTVASEVSARATGFVAKHPRLVATMMLLLVLLAMQGGVAAETTDFVDFSTTNAEGGVDTGP